jgi:3-hydroxybutyrate dehydrogenase
VRSAGLGEAVAASLAAAGANVVLHDLVEPKETRDRLQARTGTDAISIAADLSRRAEIEAMMAELLGRLGAIDILVNNAVVRHFAPVEQFPPEKWDEALAVNLSAPFHLIRLSLPAMRQRNWGRIINMASIYATRAVADRIDYVTTKTAILGITRAVALETATTGITCNAICPGWVLTPLVEKQIKDRASGEKISIEKAKADLLSEKQPSHEFATAEQIGALTVFLCSEAAAQIRGAALPIDGGWTAQ